MYATLFLGIASGIIITQLISSNVITSCLQFLYNEEFKKHCGIWIAITTLEYGIYYKDSQINTT